MPGDGQVMVKEATSKGYAVAKEGDSINFCNPNSKTRRGRVGKGIAQTLDTGMEQATIINKKGHLPTIGKEKVICERCK